MIGRYDSMPICRPITRKNIAYLINFFILIINYNRLIFSLWSAFAQKTGKNL